MRWFKLFTKYRYDLFLKYHILKKSSPNFYFLILIKQASISDWSAENNSLIEYGRLIKDGELKMRSHEDSRNAKLRYVFILNRCVIFCKATRVSSSHWTLGRPSYLLETRDKLFWMRLCNNLTYLVYVYVIYPYGMIMPSR